MSYYFFDKYVISEEMCGALERYEQHHLDPGGFLKAVLANDLVEAVNRADEINLYNLPAYAAYLVNEEKPECWGSKKVVEAWLKKSA